MTPAIAEFVEVINSLDPEKFHISRTAIINANLEYLPNLIQNADDLVQVLNAIDSEAHSEQHQFIIRAMLPKLPSLVNSSEHLGKVLPFLDNEEFKKLFSDKKHFIKSVDDLKLVLNGTGEYGCKEICTHIANNDPQVTMNQTQFLALLKSFNPSNRNDHTGYNNATRQRAAVIEGMINKLPELIKTKDALHYILNNGTSNVSNALSAEVFKTMGPQLPNLFKDTESLIEFVKTLDHDKQLAIMKNFQGDRFDDRWIKNKTMNFFDTIKNASEVTGSSNSDTLLSTTKSGADKQQELKTPIMKCMLALYQQDTEKDDTKLRKQFNNLLTQANTHRSSHSLFRFGNTASCNQLIDNLSKLGDSEKNKLIKALDLSSDGKSLSPKEFKAALTKHVENIGKGDTLPKDVKNTGSNEEADVKSSTKPQM